MNGYQMDPLSVRTGAAPRPEGVRKQLLESGAIFVPATDLAVQAQSPKSANVVLMGALSTALPFDPDVWLEVISGRVPPKTVEANRHSFSAGRDLCISLCGVIG